MNGLRLAPLVLGFVFVLPSTVLADWPPDHCDHVRILEEGDDDEIAFYFGAELENATDDQKDALADAIDLMPEVLCQAVRRVAFVDRPPSPISLSDSVTDAWTNRNQHQDLVYLNTRSGLPWNRYVINSSSEKRAAGIQRFIHESTHTAIRMIQSQQKAEPYRMLQERADPKLWPPEARQLARQVIESNRLESGILREWQRMHDAFVRAGMSEAYWGDGWKKKIELTTTQFAAAGFTSAYSGKEAIEDIAEMTSWAIIRDAASNPEDAACRVMNRNAGASISRDEAAIFTKLGFVRTLGFITEDAYRKCVGNLKIEVPGEGLFSYVDGNLSVAYTGNPRAGVGRGSGEDEQWLIADITADGMPSTSSKGDFSGTMSLQLNVTPLVDAVTDPGKKADRLAIAPGDVSYPRGVYLVGFRYGKLNRLQLTRRDDGGVIMDVAQGIALVSRASSEGIEGSIFVERIFNFSGGLLSSVAGDEPVKKPTKITFKYDPK